MTCSLARGVRASSMGDLSVPIYYELFPNGYPGDPAVLPERLRERELRPRSRRPIQEWTISGQWGNPIAAQG